MKVRDMRPGDVIANGDVWATVIVVVTDHPYYPRSGLSLVIWRMDHGVFFDALSPDQEIGDRMPRSGREQLRVALGIMKGHTR